MRSAISTYVLTAALTAALLLAGWSVWTSSGRAQQNHTALAALCLQREDLDRQIEASEQILRVEHGRKVFGIPRSLLVSNLHSRKTFRRNLSILDCPEKK